MIFRNRNYIKSKNIHVILVSTNSNSDIDAITEPEIRELEVQKNISSYSSNIKVVIEQCDYNYFMSNLSSYLNKISDSKSTSLDSPIFIFQGLHLSTLTSLFKQSGYTFHGGSMTLRHKLSSLEYNLSVFLYITELDQLNTKIFYYTYF